MNLKELAQSPEDLPLYQCFKQVRALKIAHIKPTQEEREQNTDDLLPLSTIVSSDELFVYVGADFMRKHNPESGGYLVIYEDGYVSYSPAAAFEAGYFELDKERKGTAKLEYWKVPGQKKPWHRHLQSPNGDILDHSQSFLSKDDVLANCRAVKAVAITAEIVQIDPPKRKTRKKKQ